MARGAFGYRGRLDEELLKVEVEEPVARIEVLVEAVDTRTAEELGGVAEGDAELLDDLALLQSDLAAEALDFAEMPPLDS
eukprot:tig00020816_g14193.t1